MKRVFIDSGAFFANLAADDAHHGHAVELFRQAEAGGWILVTTNAVIFETHALVLSRARDPAPVARRFLESVEARLCRVERVSRRDEARALEILLAHSDKGYSFCDALSFVVMERLNIREAIAFDRHFRQYGRFKLL